MREADTEAELLALRLRTATVERRREAAADQRAEEDALRRRPPLLRARRALLADPAAAVAGGYAGTGPGGVRVPLAGLAGVTGPAAPRWHDALSVGGVTLPAVECPPPSALRFALQDGRGAVVRAFAALRPAAWFHNRGGVRFALRELDAGGAVLGETARVLHPASRAADRGWVPLVHRIAAGDERIIELAVTVPEGGPPDYAWAVWGDPVLLVPAPGATVAPLPDPREALRGFARGRRPGPSSPPPAGQPATGASPAVSFLLPVHDPAPELLREALASVMAQTDPAWQLCVADDGSTDPEVGRILSEIAEDPRVDVQRHARAQGISAATNLALGHATAPMVATLDHDDLLAPDAVAQVRVALAADPAIDVLYSDNDKVGPGGERFSPSLKPGWSPELLRACMYTLHLSVYRRALVHAVGGWRSAFDGAQDHDLLLRISERTGGISHLPATLYSWRAHAGSAALGELAKPEAYDRGALAIAEQLERIGIGGTVERLEPAGRYRVRYAAPSWAGVAVVVPLTAAQAEAPGTASLLEALADAVERAPGRVELVTTTRVEATSWGAAARAQCEAIGAEVVVLVHELSAPRSNDWLEELTGPLVVPGVVASGPVVVDGGGAVLHAGVALIDGLPLGVHQGGRPDVPGASPELTMVTNRASLSGVVALRREAACEHLSPAFGQQALADLTARLTAGGGRAVCSPHAPWHARADAPTVPVDLQELRRFAQDHGTREDRWYNPRFWRDRADHVVPRALEHIAAGG